MPVVDCRQVKEQELIERYLVGQLDESEQEAFEQHYFECALCQEKLETCRTLQRELVQRAAEIRTEPVHRRVPRTWYWAPALVVAAAVVVLAVWLSPRPTSTTPTTTVATSPITQTTPTTASVDAALIELAKVEPPPYTPVILRGAVGQARHQFQNAMTHYENGNCVEVLPGLHQAARLDPTLPEANFYLGACSLLTGNDKQAIASLKKTVAEGETPYLEDAHFYLAKAYLRAHDLTAARGELEKAVRLEGDRENEARQLLQQLAALARKSP